MEKLSPFEERLVKLRLNGMTLLQITEHTGRRYGTVRNYFVAIYRKLNINLLCELNAAWTTYEYKMEKSREEA